MKQSWTVNDDANLDRLVDGELSEDERRDLLTRLDAQPNGWRRCALAFLEAQCWKETFRGLAARADAKAAGGRPSYKVVPVTPARPTWSSRLQTIVALAACIAASLMIGSWWSRGHNPATQQIAANAPPSGGSAVDRRRPEAGDGPWRMVTLSSPSGDLQLPAVERPNVDEAWLQGVPSAIPDEVLQALNRTGHQVQQRRELIPVPMQGGQQLFVPVDKVDVRYIGNSTY